MAVTKSSLSAGSVIRAVLLDNPEVASRTSKIFPVVTDSAELPYITYRRRALEASPQKSGQPGADTVEIEVSCFTAGYAEGVMLAEAVRGALDYTESVHDGLRLRACHLIDSEESFAGDAYVQLMVFGVKM